MAADTVKNPRWDDLLQTGTTDLPKMVIVWLGGVVRKK